MIKAELIDYMGDDLRVVNAARVSFDKDSKMEEAKDNGGGDQRTYRLSERDAKLIHYLAKHNHWTPFSHCVVTMRETVPIFVARQRFKHVVGFTYNEVSRRYVDSEPEFFDPTYWRARAENKKQGSSHEEIPGYEVGIDSGAAAESKWVTPTSRAEEVNRLAVAVYREMVEHGICPEQARMVLPQSMVTKYYVTGSLAAWARAYKLRSGPDAQAEIRQLAMQWCDIIAPLFPTAWKALVNEA